MDLHVESQLREELERRKVIQLELVEDYNYDLYHFADLLIDAGIYLNHIVSTSLTNFFSLHFIG
jgi:hypothetical protein